MFHKELDIMTLKEIEQRLRWFHGEDFEKYPLTEEHFQLQMHRNRKYKK